MRRICTPAQGTKCLSVFGPAWLRHLHVALHEVCAEVVVPAEDSACLQFCEI
jgi:hypothetical protein